MCWCCFLKAENIIPYLLGRWQKSHTKLVSWFGYMTRWLPLRECFQLLEAIAALCWKCVCFNVNPSAKEIDWLDRLHELHLSCSLIVLRRRWRYKALYRNFTSMPSEIIHYYQHAWCTNDIARLILRRWINHLRAQNSLESTIVPHRITQNVKIKSDHFTLKQAVPMKRKQLFTSFLIIINSFSLFHQKQSHLFLQSSRCI